MNRIFKEIQARKAVTATVMATALGVTGVAGGLAAASASQTKSATPPPLVMESSQESSVNQTFNPFQSNSASTTLGMNSLIYEPLIQFDPANTKIVYPWLATAWKWGNGGRSITFTIRSGVQWSNGSPFSAADVAYTYNLLKSTPALNTSGLPLTGVSQSGDSVTLSFSTPQYDNLQAIASVYIVPQSIWSKISDPATYTDAAPVGTGPFVFSNYNASGITLTANPHYWQANHVPEVIFPTYASSSAAESALLNGTATWEGNFIPGIQQSFGNTSKNHLLYFAPVNTNSFFPNLHKFPTNQLAVRKAISLGINRTLIGKIGESGLEAPVTNASGLTLPAFTQYLTPAAKKFTENVTPEVAAARKVLEKAGWKLKGHFFYKGGKELTLQISDPSNYSDYYSDDGLAVRELRAVGFNAILVGDSDNGWYADIADGGFELTQHWSLTSINPYNLYHNWLAANVSSSAGNFEQLRNPAVDKMLNAVAAQSTTAGEAKALLPIEKFVATDYPVIPTVYGAAFMEANSTNYTNWPSAKNTYESGSPNAPTNEVVVLHLQPVG
jgi:peptide/nickel transport system substrate-binding protein